MLFNLLYFIFPPSQLPVMHHVLHLVSVSWFSVAWEMLKSTAAFYFHSLITLANLPPSGLANIVADGMRSEENVYTIEENVYEVEDSSEYYCSVVSGQQSW